MDAPFVSVVIAAGRTDVTDTVMSLREQDYPLSRYEIIVVSERENLIAPPCENLRLVPCVFSNPAFKRNMGVDHARGEIIAFIDDDAVAPETWLRQGIQLLSERSEYAGGGGPNLLPPGAPFAEKLSDAILTLPLIGSGTGAYRKSSGVASARAGDIHLVNMFVHKRVFLDCGGLNESVGYGGEDSEFIVWVEAVTRKRFFFAGDLIVYHHRRPFGLAYIQQRFLLRVNNGRLFVARPGLYSNNLSFWGLLAAPLALLAALMVSPIAALVSALAYLGVVIVVSSWAQPKFFVLLPFAVIIHHLTYVAGVYWGLISVLVRRDAIHAIRIRKRIQ